MLFNLNSEAQRWKRTRYELIYGVGYSSIFGDIGGGSGKAGNIATSIKDFDIQTIRPSVAFGFRYRVTEVFAVKGNLIYGLMGAADKYSKELTRQERGISLSSQIFEQSLQFEYSVVKERLGRRYTISNIKGLKNLHINTYFIAGVGNVNFFNTVTKVFNKKVEATETNFNGQDIRFSDGAVYKKSSLVIPIGIGFKYGINRKLSLAVEYGNRFIITTIHIQNQKIRICL